MELDFGDNGKGERKQFQTSPFKKKGNCPLCGKRVGWNCDVTEDDGLVYCSYTPSEKTDNRGRFEHILKQGHGKLVSAENKEEEKMIENVKADADKLNEVYTEFLESLELNNNHSNDLINRRGLSDDTVARKLYASVPSYQQRFEAAEKLAESFDLEGIPGFYLENGRWALNLTFPGFYVPYRDVEGRIVGLQIRQDKNTDNKYLWLSSSGKEKGTSSGTPLHIVNPDLIRDTRAIYLTEGALKADVIGEKFFSVGVVAIGGVNVIQPQKLIEYLANTFPDLRYFWLAFDMDWKTNTEVRKSILRLLEGLKETSLKIIATTWDEQRGKGFDDVCGWLRESQENMNTLRNYSGEEFEIVLRELEAQNLEPAVDSKVESLPDFEKNINDQIDREKEIINTYSSDDDLEKSAESELREIDTELAEQAYENANTFGITWGDFSKAKFPKSERIIFGLNRGNIGLLNASTNVGKSSLILNVALSAASNRIFEPFVTDETVGSKVLYIDGEATQSELQDDIKKMAEKLSSAEQELLENNLCLICDEEIDDESLDLVNPDHRNKVLDIALQFKADLIVIDTLSALTIMEDENDNAKVKKEVLQPLKNLAKKANAAVLILHHTGKWNEGSAKGVTNAYKGRGASAFGALARTTFYLEADKKENRVRLSCPKVKGAKFETAILELDSSTRWFKFIGEDSKKNTSNADNKYEKVIKFVMECNKPVKREDIVKAFEGIISDKTVDRNLRVAVGEERLNKSTYGFYTAPQNVESELPLAE
jgi:archaellum biogenesis ATPase FlaH